MFNWLRKILRSLNPDAGKAPTGSKASGAGTARRSPTPAAKQDPILVRGRYWKDTSETGWTLAQKPDTMSGLRIDDLIKGLERPDRAEVRRAAADTLRRMGADAAPAMPALVRAAIDIDESVRQAATAALASIDTNWPHNPEAQKAFPDLVRALHSWPEEKEEAAFELLIFIGSPAVPDLAGGLMAGEESAGDIRIMQVLARMGPDAAPALPALKRALESHNPQTRIAAAQALGHIGPQARPAIPALNEALADSNPRVRAAAKKALAEVGDRDG